MDSLARDWYQQFLNTVQQSDYAAPLRAAGVENRLGDWTIALTAATVATCEALGWQAAAKGSQGTFSGIKSSEYLNIDVMGFDTDRDWAFPIAAIELENQRDRTAYSLWKVLCIRAPLRLVFGYVQTSEERLSLVRDLERQVLKPIPSGDRADLTGETLIAIGSRADSDLFPYDYFKWWQLETNTGTLNLFV